jgi:hypothetical protein
VILEAAYKTIAIGLRLVVSWAHINPPSKYDSLFVELIELNVNDAV